MNDELYAQARSDVIELLGFSDVERLSASQVMKIDLVTALKLSIDTLQAQLIVGEKTDVTRLLAAAEVLERLLPPAVSENQAPITPRLEDSAREKMQQLIDSVAAAREFEEAREVELLRAANERLLAENAQLRAAQPAAPAGPKLLPPPAKSAPATTESAQVPQHYQRQGNESWRPFVDRPGSSFWTPRASWDRGGGDRGW
jgi:hypothetical protein